MNVRQNVGIKVHTYYKKTYKAQLMIAIFYLTFDQRFMQICRNYRGIWKTWRLGKTNQKCLRRLSAQKSNFVVRSQNYSKSAVRFLFLPDSTSSTMNHNTGLGLGWFCWFKFSRSSSLFSSLLSHLRDLF